MIIFRCTCQRRNQMVNKKIKKLEEDSNIEIIQELIKNNGGYITSKIITDLGIHRMYLKKMLENNMIEKVDKGIYIAKDTFNDKYYTLQLRYNKIIFSRFTALYFYGLTELYPDFFDITVDYNYHVDDINNNNYVIKCNKNILDLGLTKVRTPYGHIVKSYDKERCICDIIKYRNKLDVEQVKKSVKMYVKDKTKNLNNLSNYSKKMGIYNEVTEYISMVYE